MINRYIMVNDCTVIDKLRKHRIFGLAIFDWSLALFGGWLIGYLILDLGSIIHWILWLILWFIIGIVIHYKMKIPTMFGYYIGLNEKPPQKEC